MTFAYLVMGPFDSRTDRAAIHDGMIQVIGVADVQDAIAVAKELQEEGISCIELCGAFGPENAKKIIDATGNTIPIGFATHLPEQEALYQATFSA